MALLAAFTLWERRSRWPLIDVRMLARGRLWAGNVVMFLAGVVLVMALVDVPLYVIEVMGQPPSRAGCCSSA